MAKRLRFTIDGVVLHAVLQNHALSESLSDMCPFTADCTRSGGSPAGDGSPAGGGHEYYTALPKKAAAKGCPSTTQGKKNGLYYFEGWNALSLVFKDCDTAPYQIHHIGDFEEDVSAVLEKMGGRIHILCELEEGG